MTHVELGAAALDAVFLVVGYALLYGLGLARLQAGDLRLIGLSYLVGWALLGCVISLSLIVGIGSGVATTLVAALLIVCVCAVRGRRCAGSPGPAVAVARGSRRPLAAVVAALGAAIIAVQAAAALVVSVKSVWTADLDAVTAWLPRASIIFHEHQLTPKLWGAFLDPWYPPLVPTMYAETFDFTGGFHPSVLPVQQVTLGIAFVLAVLGLLDRYVPRWISFPSLALLITAPWFWWRLHSLLPDQTVGYLIVTAALICVIWLHERRDSWLALAVVLLAAATLTKMEGLPFAAILVVVILGAGLVLHGRAALRGCVLLLGPAAILPWHFWLARQQLPASTSDYNASHAFSPGFLAGRFDRLTYALDAMAGGRPLTIVWLAIVVILVTALVVPSISATVSVWLTLSFCSLLVIYWLGRLPIKPYVEFTASRVGGTIVIGAATMTPLLLGLALIGRSPPSSGDKPLTLVRLLTPFASKLRRPGPLAAPPRSGARRL